MMTALVRVTTVRSRGLRALGGCIFSGRPIDDRGTVIDAGASIVIKASGKVLEGSAVQAGQWWRVTGIASQRNFEVNGYHLTETQIEASTATMERPSGEHIVSFIAEDPSFAGIGYVKARKMWETFGDELYAILDEGDASRLSGVLSIDTARQVVDTWAQQGDSRTLQWLQAQGFDVSIGRKVMQFFGPDTEEKLEEDPYRLLSFSASWRNVDQFARAHFDVPLDDPRRLQGAIEEACYRTFSQGHTTTLSSQLMDQLYAILGSQSKTFRWRDLVHKALSQGLANGSYVIGHHGVQPLGAYLMEREVARAVAGRVARSSGSRILSPDSVDALLADYEAAEGISLNSEQRAAVEAAMAHCAVLVTGGAGVGKTTVLKAMYRAYDAAGIDVVQLALAGRAAKRMQEATERRASTIANFLANAPEQLDDRTVVVVDEASMVDIITMSRLCESIGPRPRLVLVGDPAQLMPVGPGLVLHALVQVPGVPAVHLHAVKRYGGAIAAAASDIRNGRWPSLPDDSNAPISFVHAGAGVDGADIATVVLDLYRRDPAGTQVLCAVRNGLDGAKHLNATCQEVLTSTKAPVRTWSDRHGTYVHTGLHLGDPVLCTRNLWDRGLQNGSLGVVTKVEDEPLALLDENGDLQGYALAWVEWDDGISRPLVEAMLDDVELGYAITVHKAQGSQWPRVIVPLTGRRLLDRTLVYTAVTRAQTQVILVGDAAAAKAAVESAPRAVSRQVALDLTLKQLLDDERAISSCAKVEPEDLALPQLPD